MRSEQISQIRDLLETKKWDLQIMIADAETVIREQLAPGDGGESRVDYNHPADMVSEAGDPDYEKEMHLLERERTELAEVEKALWRLDNDKFGRCESCDDQIPFDRLLAVPHTHLCISCSSNSEAIGSMPRVRPIPLSQDMNVSSR